MYKSIVEAIFAHAEKEPEKLCLADEIRKVTYKEYKTEILKKAKVFKSLGVEKNSKVTIEASQTVDFLGSQMALQLLGGVFVPMERGCAFSKLVATAENSDSVLAIASEKEESEIKALTMAEFVALSAESEEFSEYSFPESEDTAELLFSTGTTGKEKGIIITHKNNVALAENVIFGVDMKKDNVEMIPSPMNHSHGLRRYYANMYMGASVVLTTGVMNVKKLFSMLGEYSVNSMDLVPTALTVLLRLSKRELSKYKDVMRYIQFGSAPLSDLDKEKVRELLPDTHLYNFYGSTESGCICIYDFSKEDKPKCIGKPTKNAKIIMVDENRNEIVSGENNTGLLVSFGGQNMSGYWKDEEETKKVLVGGAVYSNDEGYYDENGDIILLGRKGDVINVGGNKVSPDEIEDTAKKMDDIADCACIGVPSPLGGRVPKLFVEMKKGREFDALKIRNFIADNLEAYKVPKQIVEIEKVPRSFNGKVLRRELS